MTSEGGPQGSSILRLIENSESTKVFPIGVLALTLIVYTPCSSAGVDSMIKVLLASSWTTCGVKDLYVKAHVSTSGSVVYVNSG